MSSHPVKRFRIYPSIGVARLGNGAATKEEAVFSPEIPWANLFETDNNYLTSEGKIKKQAQRFYVYECDDKGRPVRQVNPDQYEVKWTAEVANKKPFWYDFNNSLDLSILSENRNLSPNVAMNQLAPGIGAAQRNPNVLNMGKHVTGGYDFRKELVNRPAPVTVHQSEPRAVISGQFPFEKEGESRLAASWSIDSKTVSLGTVEYDKGTLIFYAGDGISSALLPSDLNTDFADNSNWYDDICDGRITATVTSKKDGKVYELNDAASSAWVFSAPPDYAPQIQPISTMYDIVLGASDDQFKPGFSLVFPLMYRLYRMQWVNLGDFLSPSFRETIDQLIADGKFKYLYQKTPQREAKAVRERIFHLFRDPAYPYNNEPIIPSNNSTSIANRGSGKDELKFPYYPGDGINYPGSPAQWFAIPPILYDELRNWKEGKFDVPEGMDHCENMDQIGEHYRRQFLEAAADDAKKPLLMIRAALETLYGGGFHPGVELTWPMRHKQLYAENKEVFKEVSPNHGLFGLREIRINSAAKKEQEAVFFNDFGFQMTSDDIRESMQAGHPKNWLWKITPGDLTKWMGIPWQSDAGSCQDVFIEKQYPIPAWWAANLPVQVLPADNYYKILDPKVLTDTKRNIYANRLDWLHTTDTGFEGYHAPGGYLNGLISMVYQWKNIGMVTGRKVTPKIDGIPEIVYVSFNGKDTDTK